MCGVLPSPSYKKKKKNKQSFTFFFLRISLSLLQFLLLNNNNTEKEITNAKLSFQSPMYSLSRAPIPYHGDKGSSISFGFGHNNEHSTVPCPFKSFNVGRVELRRGRLLLIKAVATFEPKSLAPKDDKCLDSKSLVLSPNPDPPEISEEESEQVDEREKLRRIRISKANKGNTPWNKGRKHSPETLQKIKERTRLAMQNPKVKMKLVNLGHAQTTETRRKIGAGVRRRWEKRRGKKMEQEICCFEWQNLIAEASRKGYFGQEELQWNSYKTMDEQLKHEWLESVEQRKQMARTPGNKRAPKPLEQRRKIAQAITAKWADPEYRGRVRSALARYYGSEAGAERKPRRRPPPSDGAQPRRRNPIMRKDTDTSSHARWTSGSKVVNSMRLKKSKPPAYKDPLVKSKLEMIKNIKAQRAAAETKHTLVIARARLLIAEAEKAAKALEVAATNSPIAQASLIESRKLIAEAIQSLESISIVDTEQEITTETETDLSFSSIAAMSEVNKEQGSAFEVVNQSHMDMVQINGHKILSSSSDDKLSEDVGKFSLEKLVNGLEPPPHLTSTNGCASLPLSLKLNSQIKESSPSRQQSNEFKTTEPSPTVVGIQSVEDETLSKSGSAAIVTKKWVCGRLVQVTQGTK